MSAPRPLPALADATVSIVGVGGLGSPAASQLAAAGVGNLRLLDDDLVEPSNLPRQLLYEDRDVGAAKVDCAARKLTERYPDTRTVGLFERLEEATHQRLLAGSDIVLDGSDNVATKYLLNALALRLRIPLIHAGLTGFRAQLMTILPGETACLRCAFGDLPADTATDRDDDEPVCQQAGVIGPLPTLFGVLQALEAIKLLERAGTPIVNRLLLHDAAAGRWRTVEVRQDPHCRDCRLASFR